MRPRFACCAALVAALGAVASGRQSQAPPVQPSFRATTTYVVLDVVVTDRRDQIVTDLTKDDFRIAERGRRQDIADFSFVSVPLAERVIDLEAPAAAPADVTSNAASPVESRAIAIVIDNESLGPQDIVRTKRNLTELIGTFTPDDQVAIVYTGRSDLGRDFTNDTGRLVRAVNNLREALGLRNLGPSGGLRSFIVTLRSVVRTLEAARQTRRALIIVGTRGCFPFETSLLNPGFTSEFCKDLIREATEAGVPIYGFDPRGELAGGSTDAITADTPGGAGDANAFLAEGADSLKTLALNTGGRAFVQSDSKRAVRDLMTENGSYYLLGYYPTPLASDGKFQDVDVEVLRPGLRVRARKGYTAPGGRVVAMTPNREMTGALGAGLPDPSLPIRAFVAPLAAGPKGARVLVTVEVAYPVPEGGFTGGLEDEWRLGILALDPDARIKASFQRPMTFTGTWKPSARGTIVVNEVIDLPTQALTLRVGVTSKALGRTGTAHLPLVVPDFRKNALQMTPLVLGVYDDDAPDAVVGLDIIRPFVPFQPTTTRVFKAGDAIQVFARAYWKSNETSVEAEVVTLGPGAGSPMQVTLQGQRTRSGQMEAVLDEAVSLAGLSPGSHVLRVTLRGSKPVPVVREVPFEIR